MAHSLVTGSNLLCVVCAYGMGKNGLLLVTCCDGHPKDWPARAKMLHEMKIVIKTFVAACSIMSV